MEKLLQQIRALPVATIILDAEQKPIRVERQTAADALAGAGYRIAEVSAEGDAETTVVAIVDPEDDDSIVAELGDNLQAAIATLTEEFADSESLSEAGALTMKAGDTFYTCS
ncbi:hypothetical protein [Lacticaseibacillus zhaodongensis]|uniref:hypothetical protein n=1 Tax=Lacticaseibacillus zhaodongensis TaxID=2668065 RepID=UPI0012D2E518|nr:hypothetical protein [Lacticaseibacillus zhaodongensis]